MSVLLLATVVMWGFPAGSLPAAERTEPLRGRLVIPGTGDSQRLLRLLAHRFEKIHPGTKIVVPKSVGSGGGIRAVGEGEAVLARVSRTLKKREEPYGLTYRAFALSPIIFVTHPSVENVAGLSSGEIVDIYSGKISGWQVVGGPSKRIYPVGREPGDSSRDVIGEHLEGFEESKTRREKIYYSTPAAVAAIEEHNFTIGYGPHPALYHTGLTILNVDGIEPNEENVLSGRYPLSLAFAVVYREPLPPLAQRFVTFLFSEDARKVLSENGAFPTGADGTSPGAPPP